MDGNRKIGLRRGIVRIVRHRSEWAILYNAELEKLNNYIGDIAVDIQHVGSTAVPGLISKPIIDIAIAVDSRKNISMVVKRLLDIGYIDGDDQETSGGYLLEKESESNVITFHIHIVENTDIQWQNYIPFRDCLRLDVKTREEYSQLKKRLAVKFRNDRVSYTKGKVQFIRNILTKFNTVE